MGVALDELRDGDKQYQIDDIVMVIAGADADSILGGAEAIRVDWSKGWMGSGLTVSRVGSAACAC